MVSALAKKLHLDNKPKKNPGRTKVKLDNEQKNGWYSSFDFILILFFTYIRSRGLISGVSKVVTHFLMALILGV